MVGHRIPFSIMFMKVTPLLWDMISSIQVFDKNFFVFMKIVIMNFFNDRIFFEEKPIWRCSIFLFFLLVSIFLFVYFTTNIMSCTIVISDICRFTNYCFKFSLFNRLKFIIGFFNFINRYIVSFSNYSNRVFINYSNRFLSEFLPY